MVLPNSNADGFSHGDTIATRGTLRIAETFRSRQGEGKLTGTDSFFIRTSGCNLRCWFCDTPYASWSPEGPQVRLEKLLDAAQQSGCGHVVLTGGEPLLPQSMPLLCRELRSLGFHLTIETAGTVWRDVTCDLLSLSPKLRSSTPNSTEHPQWAARHQATRLPIATMRRLIDQSVDAQVKFVVASPEDFAEIEAIVEDLRIDTGHVWIMPEGVTVAALDQALGWLRPWCEAKHFTYGDRMQIRWYGNHRGT